MQKKILIAILTVCLTISLSGCFPTIENNYSTRKNGETDKINIENISGYTEHISETAFDNFSIDADVNVEVTNNFNVYTAVSSELDFELFQNLFVGDKKLVDSYSEDEHELINYYEDDSSAIKIKDLINQNQYDYISRENSERELEWIYMAGNDFNGPLDFERDIVLPKKELDFMSSDKACALVEEKMKTLGIETDNYNIYAVDYDYIVKRDSAMKGEFQGLEDDWEFVEYQRDDEFYIIVPEFHLPNEGLLTEMYYTQPEDTSDNSVYSGIVYGIVGKNGILKMEISGLFDITGEDTDIQEIVTPESAWVAVKESYKDVVFETPVMIDNVQLSYVPYLSNKKEGIFELKPTWIFSMVKTYEDGTKTHALKLVDAIAGNVVVLGDEDMF